MPNDGEYKSRIGLDSLYVATITADTAAAYTPGTPAYLAPAAEATQEPTTSFETQYADDQPYDIMTSEGPTAIKLVITGLDLQTLAQITGRVFDAGEGRLYDNGGTPPYMALSFRSKKSNGSYRYYQYLKGKFEMPKEETATLGEKPEPKTLELTYTAIRTIHKFDLWAAADSVTDSVKRIIGDEDTDNFDATGWFTAVQVPTTPSA
jgi:phi13 family phage major tail protein